MIPNDNRIHPSGRYSNSKFECAQKYRLKCVNKKLRELQEEI